MERRNIPRYQWGRAPCWKVYMPYSEEYLRRCEMRRNAVLADVLRPADLGINPIATVKSALARRFGGYTEDFTVARYRERNFAIFLSEWVQADRLVRREVLALENFWLRCYPWGRYRTATPHHSGFQAWIRLMNLPFEIWTAPRVVTIVGGFGRFVRADDVTKGMTDLRDYRCQIILANLHDIPQNLSIVVGDEVFAVMVHLEEWEWIGGGRGDGPRPPPPPFQGEDGRDADVGENGNGLLLDGDLNFTEVVEGEDEGELAEVGRAELTGAAFSDHLQLLRQVKRGVRYQ